MQENSNVCYFVTKGEIRHTMTHWSNYCHEIGKVALFNKRKDIMAKAKPARNLSEL